MTTAERVKAIRKASRLTQAAFAKWYGIPKRTIENWEGGQRDAPSYVLDLLAKEAAAAKVIPMAWVWHEYRDKAGTGHFEVFRTRAEALAAASDYWDRLAAVDKKKYLDDPAGDFSVGLYEMEWDDVGEEYLPDFGQGALILAWSPMLHG